LASPATLAPHASTLALGATGELSGVSCPSSTTCYAVGQLGPSPAVITRTTNDGGSWTVSVAPKVTELQGIACPTPTNCVAVGDLGNMQGAVLLTSDGGASWSSASLPSAVGMVYAVSCPSAAVCFAVTDSLSRPPSVIRSTNGGATWSPQVLPLADRQGSLYSVSCASSTVCAVGGALRDASDDLVIDLTRDGGVAWEQGGLSPHETLGAVSGTACAWGTSTCLAVGQAEEPDPVQVWKAVGVGTRWATVGWDYGDGPSGLGALNAIVCPSAADCYAVGQAADGVSGAIFSTTDGGQAWRPAQLPASVSDLEAVSCSGPTTCMAVGVSGEGEDAVLTTADGATWSLT